MTSISNYIENIKSQFATGSIENTIQLLTAKLPNEEDIYYDLLLIANEYNDIKQQELHGVLSLEQAQLRINRVRIKILDFIRKLTVEDFFGYNVENGIKKYKDGRDNRIYSVLEIFDQVWMIENLNFETEEGSWYYDDNPSYGQEYGRLYDWETAKDVCWPGWRLPSIQDCQRFDKKLMEVSTIRHERILMFRKLNFTTSGQKSYNEYEGLNKLGYYWTSTVREKNKKLGDRVYTYIIFPGSSCLIPSYNKSGASSKSFYGCYCRYIKDL